MVYAKWIEEDYRFGFSVDDNDGVKISDEYWNELLLAQAHGQAIVPDANGYPVNYARTLDDVKFSKRQNIKSDCGNAITLGIDHNALGAIHHYPTTRDDQVNLNGLVSKSMLLGDAGGPYKFWCADADSAWDRRDHSAAQIQAIGLAVASHVIAAQDNYALKLIEIDAAQTLEQLDLIVWP